MPKKNGAAPGRKVSFLSPQKGRLSRAALFYPEEIPRLRVVCVRLWSKDSIRFTRRAWASRRDKPPHERGQEPTGGALAVVEGVGMASLLTDFRLRDDPELLQQPELVRI